MLDHFQYCKDLQNFTINTGLLQLLHYATIEGETDAKSEPFSMFIESEIFATRKGFKIQSSF